MPNIDGIAPGWVRNLDQFNLELEFDGNMARMLGTPNLPDLAVLTTDRLIWAAVDAGRHISLEPDMHSDRKFFFNSWRITSALGFLNFDGEDYLCGDSVLPELEQTEKTQVGHAIGALCASAIAWELLAARAVVHVSTMDKYYPGWIRYGAGVGRRRPDYIAVDFNRDCFVLEAKGRSGLRNKTKKELRKKAQAGAVAGIYPLLQGQPNPLRTRGFVPKAQVGIATDYGAGRLKVFATDPPPDMAVLVSPEEIVRVYYSELFEKCTREDDPIPAVPGIGLRFQLQVPDHLEQYTAGLPEGEDERLPSWRRIEGETADGTTDRFVLRQQFQAALIEAGMTGDEWTWIRNVPIEEIQMASPEPQTRRMLQLANTLWGENGGTIMIQILRNDGIQPDGTRLRLFE